MQLEGEAAKSVLMGLGQAMINKDDCGRKADLQCPECQADLHYPEGGVIHLDPDRRRVKCKACQFKGFHYLDSSEVK